MKLITQLLVTSMMAAALLPMTALAQNNDTRNQGYLVDSRGEVVMSGSGLCWHTSDWTPARAVEPCDALIRPVAAATPTPSAAAVTPTPTPAPALSAPAPNAVALMPVPQKISLSSDALFSFDKFVLRPEGQAKLDDLVHQLDGAVYDSVLVTGHTDRLGSNAYNQKLSDRRAQAVKDYLVTRNVPANVINAKGLGETQPVTKAGECTGRRSAKLISCLQPDRRVDVEVVGTKVAK